ncbi:GerW family sporulation protein [Streptomyces coerulescens]|uniref:GerW family sporulation protein n=1 Tax=Streptomyces coerulescens TaxID=29304 RepID=A0ABW0CCF7_STRCD
MTAHKEDKEAKEDAVPVSSTDLDGTAAHASVTLLERLAEKLGGRASVTAVYGEAVTADGITVIPVAKVAYGFGGGAGRSVEGAKAGDGGGGGGGVEARPLGYIEIRDGVSTYRPIRDTWRDIVLPLGALALALTLPKAVRSLRRRR